MSLLNKRIAFTPEEAISQRVARRQSEKKLKGIYVWRCPRCGHEEYGGATAVNVVNVSKDGEKRIIRIPRRCPRCGSNMIKFNPYKKRR